MSKVEEQEETKPQLKEESLLESAQLIKQSKTIIITAGAGMGVDSGLPDFRSKNGFWKAYPRYESLGLDYMEVGTPYQFLNDPAFGWGFYGHRTIMYREAIPHKGFQFILNWIELFGLESFVVTSNVDGQFQKAGFDPDSIVDAHGSIHYLQCLKNCTKDIWKNDFEFEIDTSTMMSNTIPYCKNCGEVARPNILMFLDFSFVTTRTNAQERNFESFIEECPKPITVVEIGAGKTIPLIRWRSEKLGRDYGAKVIRINPFEPEIAKPHISIPEGGAKALELINSALNG